MRIQMKHIQTYGVYALVVLYVANTKKVALQSALNF